MWQDPHELSTVCTTHDVLHVFGFPFAWKKFKGGFQVSWIGFWADMSTWQVGLSDSRAAWVAGWLDEFIDGEIVYTKRVAEGLGRLGFAVGAASHYKPFLGPPPRFRWASRSSRSS